MRENPDAHGGGAGGLVVVQHPARLKIRHVKTQHQSSSTPASKNGHCHMAFPLIPQQVHEMFPLKTL